MIFDNVESLFCYDIITKICVKRYQWIRQYGADVEDLITEAMLQLYKCAEVARGGSTRNGQLAVACRYAVMKSARNIKQKHGYVNVLSECPGYDTADSPMMPLSTYLLESNYLTEYQIPEPIAPVVPIKVRVFHVQDKYIHKIDQTDIFEVLAIDYQLDKILTEKEMIVARKIVYGTDHRMIYANLWKCSYHTILCLCKTAVEKIERARLLQSSDG